MIGTAAAVGVQSVLDSLPGTLAAIGTPAEEGGGGKVALLRAGGVDGGDTAMMIHPPSGRAPAGRHSLPPNPGMGEFRGRAPAPPAPPDPGHHRADRSPPPLNNVDAT